MPLLPPTLSVWGELEKCPAGEEDPVGVDEGGSPDRGERPAEARKWEHAGMSAG